MIATTLVGHVLYKIENIFLFRLAKCWYTYLLGRESSALRSPQEETFHAARVCLHET
jgi:hypothetical protein